MNRLSLEARKKLIELLLRQDKKSEKFLYMLLIESLKKSGRNKKTAGAGST
jgi:hypothetical protein